MKRSAVKVNPDGELVRRALAGEAEAFRGLIERYQDAVFGVALSRALTHADAEDIAQETFLAAFGSLARLKDPDRFGSWLYGIAVNQVRMHVRRQRRRAKSEREAGVSMAERAPDELAEKREISATVMTALAGLPQAKREAAMLYYIDGYSVGDISRFANCPPGTIKRRLHEARSGLRKELLTMVEVQLKRARPGRKFTENTLRKITAARVDQRGGSAGHLLVADSNGRTYASPLGREEAAALHPTLSGRKTTRAPDIHAALVGLLGELGYKILSVTLSRDVSPNQRVRLKVRGGGRTKTVEAVYSGRHAIQFALMTGGEVLYDSGLAEKQMIRRKDGKPMSLAGALRRSARRKPKPPFRNIHEAIAALEKNPDSRTARRALGQAGPSRRYETPLMGDGGRGVEDLKDWMSKSRGSGMEGIAAGLVGARYLDHPYGNLSEAQRYLEKGHRLRPKDKRIAFDLATLYAQLGKADEAFALLLTFDFDDAGQYRNFLRLEKDPRFQRINVASDPLNRNVFRIEQTDTSIVFGKKLPWEVSRRKGRSGWSTVAMAKTAKVTREQLRRLTNAGALVAARSASVHTSRSENDSYKWLVLLELEDGRPVAVALPVGFDMRSGDVTGALYPGSEAVPSRSVAAVDVLTGLGVQVEAVVICQTQGQETIGWLTVKHGRRRGKTIVDGLAGLSVAFAAKRPVLLSEDVAEELCVRGKAGRPLSINGAKKRLRAGGPAS